jgi:hypothetical protein
VALLALGASGSNDPSDFSGTIDVDTDNNNCDSSISGSPSYDASANPLNGLSSQAGTLSINVIPNNDGSYAIQFIRDSGWTQQVDEMDQNSDQCFSVSSADGVYFWFE